MKKLLLATTVAMVAISGAANASIWDDLKYAFKTGGPNIKDGAACFFTWGNEDKACKRAKMPTADELKRKLHVIK